MKERMLRILSKIRYWSRPQRAMNSVGAGCRTSSHQVSLQQLRHLRNSPFRLQVQRQHGKRFRLNEAWDPKIRALSRFQGPILLYRARSDTPRMIARWFIAMSCFIMAGHATFIVIDPPEGFNSLLRRSMVVVAIALGSFGVVSVSRNVLAVKAITAVTTRKASQNVILLHIETTKYLPWNHYTYITNSQNVRISRPLPNLVRSMPQETAYDLALWTALSMPLKLVKLQFGHFYDAFRQIVFTDGTFLAIEGQSTQFRLDEDPIFVLRGMVNLNTIVKITFV